MLHFVEALQHNRHEFEKAVSSFIDVAKAFNSKFCEIFFGKLSTYRFSNADIKLFVSF